MKKAIVLIFLAFFMASCSGTLVQSEFMEHDTLYKNWDHMKFSWYGHRNPTAEDQQNSAEQQWWGFEVPYIPGE
ncbi:hypothetical protein DSCA_15200 [Desulfosarcina alkanivorans]|jgi:hypothetical protein|uniref:Lipoprotein n=1 Tax=Desulfosarcina alkanivorans TaxID=571177 RepID=A0A5K7YHN3_9BACT|nr:hypothetical protein [Desulfosarcina alkanivorans]BBO67590.1 hypothetical protein DSCA_15200 [Desulfosarcina alkanivorans]